MAIQGLDEDLPSRGLQLKSDLLLSFEEEEWRTPKMEKERAPRNLAATPSAGAGSIGLWRSAGKNAPGR